MQGLESLSQFKKFVSSLGGLGRYGDTYMIHAEEGETVVPMEVLDRNPVLKKRLFKSMKALGIDPGRYIVGNDLNSLNPVTGQPEFFFKKIIKQIRKAIPGDLEQYLGPIVGMATGNPWLGAIAGGIGSGAGGALAGGLGGWRSPGIAGLGRGAFGYEGAGKVGAMDFGDLFSKKGAGRFFLGDEDKAGLFGKFDFMDKTDPSSLTTGIDTDEYNAAMDLKNQLIKDGYEAKEASNFALGTLEKAVKAKESVLGGMSLMDAAKLWGLGTAGFGILIKLTEEDVDAGTRLPEYVEHGQHWEHYLNPATITYGAKGGVMDLQGGGFSQGPGTGTSDSIPAMLSDGEFVMTADAVRGAGGGNRREGARKMYEAMNRLEARA